MSELTIPALIEKLVDTLYAIEKIKYPLSADRRAGYVTVTWIMAYGLEFGFTTQAIVNRLKRDIADYEKELSDLSAKVEV